MLIVLALGGNALLRRGEPMRPDAQLANIRAACAAIAPLANDHRLVITHGNGPQVGLLALREADGDPFPLDVLDAESEGMIGYLIERELRSLLGPQQELAVVLTMVEVDPGDPAFANPTKPIGPTYDADVAQRLASIHHWTVKHDESGYRRVVASPEPVRIVELEPIRMLLERGCVVICTGGGGIPVTERAGSLEGIQAVIDKDLASALLAAELAADLFVMATDVDGVYADWGTPSQSLLREAELSALREQSFAAGSMGPKVEAACRFVAQTQRPAVIGALEELGAVVEGRAGTRIVARRPAAAAAGNSRF